MKKPEVKLALTMLPLASRAGRAEPALPLNTCRPRSVPMPTPCPKLCGGRLGRVESIRWGDYWRCGHCGHECRNLGLCAERLLWPPETQRVIPMRRRRGTIEREIEALAVVRGVIRADAEPELPRCGTAASHRSRRAPRLPSSHQAESDVWPHPCVECGGAAAVLVDGRRLCRPHVRKVLL
jgi:hypothetical protein